MLMTDYYSYYAANDYLAHHGVLGMKWGQHIFGRDQKSGAHQLNRAQNKEKIKEGKKKASKKTRIASAAAKSAATLPGISIGASSALNIVSEHALATKLVSSVMEAGTHVIIGESVAAAAAPLTVASFAPSIVFAGAVAYGGYALAKKFTDNNYKQIADKK